MIPLSPIEQAAHQEFEYYGSTLTTNTALKAMCLVLTAAILALAFWMVHLSREVVARQPIVVRVNDVGKAEVVNLKYNTYTPQDAEIRYFLNQFVTGFYARNHRTVRDAYPTALAYLSSDLFAQIDTRDRRSQWAAKFLTSGDDDVDVTVRNIALDDSHQPYRAQVEAERVNTSSAGQETKRQPFIVTLYFRIDASLALRNPDLVRTNPLGFSILSIHEDDALQ